jgi:glycosyltransferase involved in cell wall biosynthesis
MPNYNGAKFISQSISSVLEQTYPFWELIVCDDKSTDNSLDIIESFKDERIKSPIKMEINQGAAVARNKAIENAKGSYIAFLDNDDHWAPQKLQEQLNFMLDNNFEFTYTDYFQYSNTYTKHIKCKMKVNYHSLLRNNYILTSTVMYNAQSLGKVYMENIRKRQDWSLFINIIKKSGFAHNLPKPLAYYRKHEASLSSSKFDLIKYNFNFYHEVLGFSKSSSFFLMIRFLFYYFLKKIKERL